ncbi:hypothetical protein FOA52_004906 [Chlamydomonas sp. UWO 241]|nr:hypothetical protein FOA52_004906 [Chlamydomonas sp. UWO 241]
MDDPMRRMATLGAHLAPAACAGGVGLAPGAATRSPWIDSEAEYKRLYKWSIEQPAAFWAAMGKEYTWKTPFAEDHVRANFDVTKGKISSEWFKGGTTNMSVNCLDRWVESGRGGQACLLWESNEPGLVRSMTYVETLAEVCRLANWLDGQGVRPGDIVTLYMPLVPELPIAMLACARIGAAHSVVFAGFSAEALAQRVIDARSRVVITANGTPRGAKFLDLKGIVDSAARTCAKNDHELPRVLVLRVPERVPEDATPMQWVAGRDVWWHDEIAKQRSQREPTWCAAEAPLFLLYTSGSTGKPKGVVHSTGGYMVSAGLSCKAVLDIQPGDVYWCTADCGWITGHTYVTYGPLLCGATVLLYGGAPQHPDPSRVWSIVAQHRVRQLYTSPTLLRANLQHGDKWVTPHDRSSLQILGTVGEPINEHAYKWYRDVVGEGRCPIMDTWWQTETGAMMITRLPGRWNDDAKPGSACLPFFGVVPVLLAPDGTEVTGAGEGVLAIKQPWPGVARTLAGDHARFESTYFAPFPGVYFTGDGARRDKEGHYWITGRVDDVINVSGHRIGTAEVESALTDHAECAEAAVIGVDHATKGQAIYAYITLMDAGRHDDTMRKALLAHVRSVIGPFAVPDVIHWAPSLPKTRSGKIMRRILRKVAMHQEGELGDLSTLSEPAVVDMLLQLRGK